MSAGAILILMGVLFLGFGYMGVPVSFALMAGVFVATAFTPVSLQSMVGQLFHGIDAETLLAVPFFLLVGELMGSSVADVAVLTRTVAPEMDKEGYDRPFTAALIACASTMANLIPPSIMAVVYGATGNVSIGGLFLAGIVPGILVGIGLMVYSYFWGPVGVMKPRASFTEVAIAARGATLPLIIPVIIMGGILTGWFTPTEAGMIASIYILVVLIPVLRPSHVRELPRDFMYAGLLYSLPLAAVAGASAFGWMVAYLRGPDMVADYITVFAGTDGRLITPPYGLSLLVASKYVGVGFGRALVRSFPLYIVFLLTIAFCVVFPEVVLWLPKLLLPESVGCFKSPTGTGYICPP